MAYPEHGARYQNRPVWLDRAVAAERPPEQDRILKDAMDAQGREAVDISDAVPRRGLAGEKRADGGAVEDQKRALAPQMEPAQKFDAETSGPYGGRQPSSQMMEQSNTMPDPLAPYRAPSSSKRGPRKHGGSVKRADGGMVNAKLSQVATEFEPAAAQDAREAAAARTRRGANDRLKTMDSPPKKMMAAASDPEL